MQPELYNLGSRIALRKLGVATPTAYQLAKQKPPKIEPMKLDKPPTAPKSMQGAPQAMQPSQWDLQVKAPKVKALS